MQSFLLGVPVSARVCQEAPCRLRIFFKEIVVGFRTPAGRLTTTQFFKTIQLPRLVRGKPGTWDPQVCLHWGQHFISTLRTLLSRAQNGCRETTPGSPSPESTSTPADSHAPHVWRVSLSPSEGVKIHRLDQEGLEAVAGGEDRVGFLPKWYFDLVSGTEAEVHAPASPAP